MHYRDVTWAAWWLKSPVTGLFVPELVQTKENKTSKLCMSAYGWNLPMAQRVSQQCWKHFHILRSSWTIDLTSTLFINATIKIFSDHLREPPMMIPIKRKGKCGEFDGYQHQIRTTLSTRNEQKHCEANFIQIIFSLFNIQQLYNYRHYRQLARIIMPFTMTSLNTGAKS